jgi:uncharacterized protein (TIGR03118 family)
MLKPTWYVKAFCGVVLALGLAPAALAQHYNRTDLTRDPGNISSNAPNVDANLINSWGLTRGTGTFWWIADNGTGLATLYDATGAPQSLVVTIPPPPGQNGPSAPTGAVFNFTHSFELAPGMPARFIFVTEDGTIAGWNPGVNPTVAILKVNRSGQAIYKGCAIAETPDGPRLYATNFQTRQVEVFDANFNPISVPGGFHFAGQQSQQGLQLTPFNIWNIGDNLVVTFAYKQPGSKDEEHGAGLGQVGIFDVSGKLEIRLQHGDWLNAPWGVALSPSDFGAFPHRLLIGNFGDGTIHAFNIVTGRLDGTLLNPDDTPVTIDGLWALSFAGDNARNGLATELYFTAGPNDENDGLFGKISAVSTESKGNAE